MPKVLTINAKYLNEGTHAALFSKLERDLNFGSDDGVLEIHFRGIKSPRYKDVLPYLVLRTLSPAKKGHAVVLSFSHPNIRYRAEMLFPKKIPLKVKRKYYFISPPV